MLFPAIGLAFAYLQTSSFPDNGANHWAYEGLSYLNSQGILIGYPEGLGRGPFMTSRYEFAQAFNAAAHHLLSMENIWIHFREKIKNDEPGSKDALQDVARAREIKSWSLDPVALQSLQYIVKAGTEFSVEIRWMGGDPTVLTESAAHFRKTLLALGIPTPGEIRLPFPDVPKNSWASGAINNLKSLSLIEGYPDGKFEG